MTEPMPGTDPAATPRPWAPSGAIVTSVTRVRTAYASVQRSPSLLARVLGFLALAALVAVGAVLLLIALLAGAVVVLVAALILGVRRLWRRLTAPFRSPEAPPDSPVAMDDLRSNVRVKSPHAGPDPPPVN